MTPSHRRLIGLLAISLSIAALAPADEVSYAKVLKERDAVLSQLVANRESAARVAGDENLVAARLALWSFRRDTASSKVEKIKQQELIVGVFQKRLDFQKSRVKAGIAGADDVLLATNSLLEEQQLLEELRLDVKKG
jgi:hypothetical protein